MKFLAFILSIYTLALNLSQCEDSIPSENNVKMSESLQFAL